MAGGAFHLALTASLMTVACGFAFPPAPMLSTGGAAAALSTAPGGASRKGMVVLMTNSPGSLQGSQGGHSAMRALPASIDGRNRFELAQYTLPAAQQRRSGRKGARTRRGVGIHAGADKDGFLKMEHRAGPSTRRTGLRAMVRSDLGALALADADGEIEMLQRAATVASYVAGAAFFAFAAPLLLRPLVLASARVAAAGSGLEGLLVGFRAMLAGLLQLSPAAAWCAYSSALARGGVVGLALKGATASATSGAGDFVSQTLERGERPARKRFDIARCARFTVLGSMIAPWVHYWYVFLGQLRVPGSGLAVGLQKMAIDQLTFSPAFLVVTFGMLAVLEGRSMRSFQRQVRTEWAPVVRDMWFFWVPAKLLSFTLVPQHLCLLFDNFMGLFWSVYLSSVVTRSKVAKA